MLDDQFKNAKDYKPKIEWFEGTWSRYRPERGKDKRGVTGADTNKLIKISNKINSIPNEINIHNLWYDSDIIRSNFFFQFFLIIH